MLKSIVYLDALITLYRMPASFEFSMPDLCRRFRDLPEVALHQILEKFCKIAISDQSDSGFGGKHSKKPKMDKVE